MPPANDDFANAQLIPGNAAHFFFDNTGADVAFEPGEPDPWGSLPPSGPAGSSLWYRWEPSVSGIAQLIIAVNVPNWPDSLSAGGPMAAVYTGEELATLENVTWAYVNFDSWYQWFHVEAGTTYWIQLATRNGLQHGYSEFTVGIPEPIEITGLEGEVKDTSFEPPYIKTHVWRAPQDCIAAFKFFHVHGLEEVDVYVEQEDGSLLWLNYSYDWGGNWPRVVFVAEKGRTYHVILGTTHSLGRSSAGWYHMEWETTPIVARAGDNLADAIELGFDGGVLDGHSLGATYEEGEPTPSFSTWAPGTWSVWYKIPPGTGTFFLGIWTLGAGYDFWSMWLATYHGPEDATFDDLDVSTSGIEIDPDFFRTRTITLDSDEWTYVQLEGVQAAIHWAVHWGRRQTPLTSPSTYSEIEGVTGSIFGAVTSTTGSIWYRWTAPFSGRAEFEISRAWGGSTDTGDITVLLGEDPLTAELISVAGEDTGYSIPDASYVTAFRWHVEEGETFFIGVSAGFWYELSWALRRQESKLRKLLLASASNDSEVALWAIDVETGEAQDWARWNDDVSNFNIAEDWWEDGAKVNLELWQGTGFGISIIEDGKITEPRGVVAGDYWAPNYNIGFWADRRGGYLYVADDGVVRKFDGDGNLVATLPLPAVGVAVDPQNENLYYVAGYEKVRRYNFASGADTLVFDYSANADRVEVWDMGVRQDGKIVLVGGLQGNMSDDYAFGDWFRVYDAGGTRLAEYRYHPCPLPQLPGALYYNYSRFVLDRDDEDYLYTIHSFYVYENSHVWMNDRNTPVYVGDDGDYAICNLVLRARILGTDAEWEEGMTNPLFAWSPRNGRVGGELGDVGLVRGHFWEGRRVQGVASPIGLNAKLHGKERR